MKMVKIILKLNWKHGWCKDCTVVIDCTATTVYTRGAVKGMSNWEYLAGRGYQS